MGSTATVQITESARRRAFAGAIVGHLIEWYDYGIYGFLAVYIGKAFFDAGNPTVALLSSFAVFALSFFVRPIGGLIFGPMGDRLGRRPVMIIVITMMAVSTAAIGLLPSYDSIGIVAPVLLVLARCFQGLSAGGETGTVAAFLAEYSKPGHRGYGTSFVMSIAVLGFLIGGLVANGLIAVLGDETMAAGGWRIPFLLAAVLGLVSLWIRLRLEDSPAFRALEERGETAKAPLRELGAWARPLTIVFFLYGLHCAIFYLVLTYSSTFLSGTLGFSTTARFWFVTLACVLTIVVIPLGGVVSDRVGRKPYLLVTGTLATASMVWFFAAADASSPAEFAAPFFATALAFGLFVGSTFATITELLPTRIRTTGVGVACNLSAAIFGGSAPFAAQWLISSTDSVHTPLWFFLVIGTAGLVSILAIRPSDFARAASCDAEVRTNDALAHTSHY